MGHAQGLNAQTGFVVVARKGTVCAGADGCTMVVPVVWMDEDGGYMDRRGDGTWVEGGEDMKKDGEPGKTCWGCSQQKTRSGGCQDCSASGTGCNSCCGSGSGCGSKRRFPLSSDSWRKREAGRTRVFVLPTPSRIALMRRCC